MNCECSHMYRCVCISTDFFKSTCIFIYIHVCLYVYMCAWCVYMCACLYAYTDANTISFYTFVNLYKYLLIYIWFLKIYVKKSCCINKGVNKCSMAFFIIGIYIYIVYSFLRQQNPYSECIHARMACILVCAIVRTHACMYVYTGDHQLQRGYTHHKHGVAKKHGVQIFPSPNPMILVGALHVLWIVLPRQANGEQPRLNTLSTSPSQSRLNCHPFWTWHAKPDSLINFESPMFLSWELFENLVVICRKQSAQEKTIKIVPPYEVRNWNVPGFVRLVVAVMMHNTVFFSPWSLIHKASGKMGTLFDSVTSPMFAIGLKLVGNRFKTSPMTSPMGIYQSYGDRFKTCFHT